MAIQYDDYVYKLSTEAPQPEFSIVLPKDLQWADEFDWDPISQFVEYGTTGSLLIQESTKLKGRSITLIGTDNMAWLTRSQVETLIQMRNSIGLIMDFSFVRKDNHSISLFTFKTMFRHADVAFEGLPIKHWDQYEPNAYYIIRSIKLMETLPFGE